MAVDTGPLRTRSRSTRERPDVVRSAIADTLDALKAATTATDSSSDNTGPELDSATDARASPRLTPPVPA